VQILESTANSQERFAPAWWRNVENNSPYQQMAVVCIHHSKRENGRAKTAEMQIVNIL